MRKHNRKHKYSSVQPCRNLPDDDIQLQVNVSPPFLFFSLLYSLSPVVDEQNAHTEEAELQSPVDLRKDSEEENRDSEKDEDTKELEALPREGNAAAYGTQVQDSSQVPVPNLSSARISSFSLPYFIHMDPLQNTAPVQPGPV